MVETSDEEASDLSIRCLHLHGPSKNFYWPSRDDTLDVPLSSISCLISPPATASGRTYQISDDYDKTVKVFAKNRTN